MHLVQLHDKYSIAELEVTGNIRCLCKSETSGCVSVDITIGAEDGPQTLTIVFPGVRGNFHALLQMHTVPGILGPRTEYAIQDSGGLAFDHAVIIASAMLKAGLI